MPIWEGIRMSGAIRNSSGESEGEVRDVGRANDALDVALDLW
jgi:hypothetical protein